MAGQRKRLDRHLRRRLITTAAVNYRYYPNVLGVGIGTKYRRGRPVGSKCVQFFVTKKVHDESKLRKTLPSFVYGRKDTGEVDYDWKLETDVITLQGLELCCSAGAPIDSLTTDGTTTLVFRNKAQGGPDRTFFFTCAHVTGSLAAFAEVALSDVLPGAEDASVGDSTCGFVGKILARTSLESGRLAYDLAIGVVTNPDTGIPDLAVSGSTFSCKGYAKPSSYPATTIVSCRLAKSNTTELEVATEDAIEIGPLTFQNEEFWIANVIPAKGQVVPGDSGGLVFLEDQAVGVVVARAKNGWCLFQPLKDAIAHLVEGTSLRIQCFD